MHLRALGVVDVNLGKETHCKGGDQGVEAP